MRKYFYLQITQPLCEVFGHDNIREAFDFFLLDHAVDDVLHGFRLVLAARQISLNY